MNLLPLVKVVNQYYPDLRKMLNTIQSSSKYGKSRSDDSLLVSTSYLVCYPWGRKLKKSKPRVLITIRQIIADSNIDDFEELFKFLYDKC